MSRYTSHRVTEVLHKDVASAATIIFTRLGAGSCDKSPCACTKATWQRRIVDKSNHKHHNMNLRSATNKFCDGQEKTLALLRPGEMEDVLAV
jgi:hypothetical protein